MFFWGKVRNVVIGIASILALQAAGAAQPIQVEAGDLRLEFTHTD